MPLILIVRFVFTLLSLAVLSAGAFFLWRWYDGVSVIDAEGVVHRVREDWPLWIGAGALAWSLAGGWLIRPLLAGKDRRILDAFRSEGRTLAASSGSSLYVESHGQPGKPTIILTHGWGLDSTIWAYAVEDLTSRFRVVIWDLPGMGLSKGKITLEGFAADLRTIIEAERGTQPVVLVGHSIGGMTIQTLVRDHSAFVNSEVAGIVLLNTTYTSPLRTMILSPVWRALRWPVLEPLLWLAIPLQPLLWLSAWQSYLSGSAHLANRLGFGRHVGRSQLNTASLLTTRNPPAAQARGNLAMFRWDATGALAKTEIPTLVIGGAIDIVTMPKATREIAAATTLSHVAIVDEANHMGFLERYDVYNQAIANFTAQVTGPWPHLGNLADGQGILDGGDQDRKGA